MFESEFQIGNSGEIDGMLGQGDRAELAGCVSDLDSFLLEVRDVDVVHPSCLDLPESDARRRGGVDHFVGGHFASQLDDVVDSFELFGNRSCVVVDHDRSAVPDGFYEISHPGQEPDGVYTFNFHYHDQDFALYREIGSPETLKCKDKTFVIQRRGGGHAPLLTPYPDDWSTPRFAYANTNMLGQLPASLDKAAKAHNLLFLYMADDVNAAGDGLKSVKLRVLLSKAASIEARLNGVLLPKPGVDELWSELATSPKLFAVGSNLISVRFTKPRSDVASDVTIEKLEVDVAYR